MSDVFVYYVALPSKVKGSTVLKDGDYIVFINECLSDIEKARALKHELAHINNNDLYEESTFVLFCEENAEKETGAV